MLLLAKSGIRVLLLLRPSPITHYSSPIIAFKPLDGGVGEAEALGQK